MNREMQALVDAPLANALALNLPAGRRPTPRSPKPIYEGEELGEALTPAQIRERKDAAASAKIVAVLDYYATTTVPFERVAANTKLTLAQVRAAMRSRGREA